MAHVLRKDRGKLDGKVDKGRFVGFTDGIKGFRVDMPRVKTLREFWERRNVMTRNYAFYVSCYL